MFKYQKSKFGEFRAANLTNKKNIWKIQHLKGLGLILVSILWTIVKAAWYTAFRKFNCFCLLKNRSPKVWNHIIFSHAKSLEQPHIHSRGKLKEKNRIFPAQKFPPEADRKQVLPHHLSSKRWELTANEKLSNHCSWSPLTNRVVIERKRRPKGLLWGRKPYLWRAE